ncbi:MAG: fibronectin type III domain-containing protein [bacterium]
MTGKKLATFGKVFLIAISVGVGIMLIYLLYSYITDPVINAKNIRITNLTDSSATVSWESNEASRGAVIVSSDNKFDILTNFSKPRFFDDRDVNTTTSRFTHHVTVTNLNPESKYYYRIAGMFKTFETTYPSLETLKVNDDLVTPDPMYGSFPTETTLDSIVYAKINDGLELSTYLNDTRAFSLDKTNTRGTYKQGDKIKISIYTKDSFTSYESAVGVDQPMDLTKIVDSGTIVSSVFSLSTNIIDSVYAARVCRPCPSDKPNGPDGYGKCWGSHGESTEVCSDTPTQAPATTTGTGLKQEGDVKAKEDLAKQACLTAGDYCGGGGDLYHCSGKGIGSVSNPCGVGQCQENKAGKADECKKPVAAPSDTKPNKVPDLVPTPGADVKPCGNIEGLTCGTYITGSSECVQTDGTHVSCCPPGQSKTLDNGVERCGNPSNLSTLTLPKCGKGLDCQGKMDGASPCTDPTNSTTIYCCASGKSVVTRGESKFCGDSNSIPNLTTTTSVVNSPSKEVVKATNVDQCGKGLDCQGKMSGSMVCVSDSDVDTSPHNCCPSGTSVVLSNTGVKVCGHGSYVGVGPKPAMNNHIQSNLNAAAVLGVSDSSSQTTVPVDGIGTYKINSISGYNLTNKEVKVIDSNNLKINFFEDLNGDGIKQDNEPFITTPLDVKIEKVSDTTIWDLKVGWNLISFNLVSSSIKTAKNLLDEITNQGGYATHVATYRNGKWVMYSQRAGIVLGQDYNLVPGEGYFVRVHQAVTLKLDGKKIEKQNPVYVSTGWNLLGFRTDANKKASVLLDGINKTDGVTVDTVTKYSDGRYGNLVKDSGTVYGQDFVIDETSGYFVRATKGGKSVNTY